MQNVPRMPLSQAGADAIKTTHNQLAISCKWLTIQTERLIITINLFLHNLQGTANEL